MMAFAMPLVIPKSRRVNLAGMQISRMTLAAEIQAQTKADLQAMLIGITREDTAQQIRLENPPQLVEVDGKTNKDPEQATKKIVVVFGTALARAAMRMVETELAAAISHSTQAKSGRLRNVGAAWQWRFVRQGGAARTVSAANPPVSFAKGDLLVLFPAAVPYATAVNRAVASAGRLNARTAKVRKRKDGTQAPAAKSSQNLGYLAATVRGVRRRSEFAQFRVIVEFTTAHAVAGEVHKYGTGVIVIRPRTRRR